MSQDINDIINQPIDLRVKKFMIPLLRRRWLFWPPRTDAIRDALVYRGNYRCNICKQTGFKRNDLHVDHINPTQSVEHGLKTWGDLLLFIVRLFVEKDKLQTACVICHEMKNATEMRMRKFYRDKKKNEE